MAITVAQIINLDATVKRFNVSPFLPGQPVKLTTVTGTPTVYGVNHPGRDASVYAQWKQTITGNKAFVLPTAIGTITQTTGGAVSAANQLVNILMVAGVPKVHTRDDQVAAASSWVIGAGGGTAVADATLSIKGTTAADLAAGSILMSIASSGADTQTILVGDKLTIAGDSTTYYCTETSQALNGTTEVEVSITPPLQAACLAGAVVTVAAADDRTILLATAPTVGQTVEFLLAGTAAVLTGGATVAGREYQVPVYEFMHTAGNVDFSRLMAQ